MEREEVGMMWHCPCCETKGDNLFRDFRVSWHPEKHGREHIPFPVQTALRNTLQGHSWNCCQIWWRWNHCASVLSPAYFSQKCSQCSCSAWPVNANTSPQCSVPECTPSAFKWLLELRDCLTHTSGIPSLSLVIRFASTVWFQQFLSIWTQVFLIPQYSSHCLHRFVLRPSSAKGWGAVSAGGICFMSDACWDGCNPIQFKMKSEKLHNYRKRPLKHCGHPTCHCFLWFLHMKSMHATAPHLRAFWGSTC